MYRETIKYRIIAENVDATIPGEVLVDSLSEEDAYTAMATYFEQGRTGLIMEEYYPEANRLGRDPDLH